MTTCQPKGGPMPETLNLNARLVALLAALAALAPFAAAAIAPSPALAGQYTVHECDPGYGNAAHSIAYYASDGRMSAFAQCGLDSGGHPAGIKVYAGINQGALPAFWSATATFAAPAGTTIH